ncbi:MAG: TolC family protein [Proteobacteria bacterium]|nr:TolC family protein [Pseudomonadota bacterium]
MSYRKTTLFTATLILLTLLPAGVYAEKLRLDLQKSIDLALKNNPIVLTARENIHKSSAQIRESSASAYPELDASADYTRIGNNEEVDFGGKSGTLIPDNNYKLDLTLSQKLYSPKVFEAIKASKSYARGVKADLNIAEEAVVTEVKTAYYDLLLSQELLTIHEASVEQLRRHLYDIKKRLEAGFATDLDLLRAEVKLANAMPDLVKARNGIEAARSSLRLAIGLDPDIILNTDSELTYAPFESTLDNLLDRAMKNRPELLQIDATIETQERYAKVEKKEYLPELTMHGNLSYANNDIQLGEDAEWGYNWNVGMTLDYKIFDGKKRSSRVTKALIDASKARLEKKRLLNLIAHEITTTYNSLEEAKTLIASQGKNIETAERAYEIATISHAGGALTQLELLDTQLELTEAKVNRSRVVHAFLIARTQLEKATGMALKGLDSNTNAKE